MYLSEAWKERVWKGVEEAKLVMVSREYRLGEVYVCVLRLDQAATGVAAKNLTCHV